MDIRLPIRIGTRGSPLARAQAALVCARLADAHSMLGKDGALETVIITTSGDRFTDRALADIGGKGLFTKEIEEALLGDRIDLAVHSMKDMPTWLPEGLTIACILRREDPRDVLIAPGAGSLADLARGARVGTASLRRQAQLLAARPDLDIVMLRGNVETRLRKIRDGVADATLLALAGLRRLGITPDDAAVLPVETMLPAVGQGAIGIECRADDTSVTSLLARLDDAASAAAVACERAMLAVLDGSCRTPIAGLATAQQDGTVSIEALIARPDGSACHRTTERGDDPLAVGRAAGEMLKAAGGPGFFGS